MRKILLFILGLILSVSLFASSDNKNQNQNPQETDLALYQQAVKAIKDKKFVLRANQFIDGDDGKLFSVSPAVNYVVVEGDKAFMKYNPEFGLGNSKEGDVSNFKIKEDKRGNIELRMRIKNGVASAKLKFYLEKGSNRCSFACYPVRYHKKFKLIGVLTPFVASDLKLKGACY